jgi:hypothetical protein
MGRSVIGEMRRGLGLSPLPKIRVLSNFGERRERGVLRRICQSKFRKANTIENGPCSNRSFAVHPSPAPPQKLQNKFLGRGSSLADSGW